MEKVIARYLMPFLRSMLYLDKEAYAFEWDRKSGISVAPLPEGPGGDLTGRRFPVIVLGKSLYYETTKTYPITSARDVKDAVTFEGSEICPFPYGRVYMKVFRQNEGQSLAQLWFIKQEALDRIEGMLPYCVLPETALLPLVSPRGGEPSEASAESREGRIYSIRKPQCTLFCFLNSKGNSFSIESRDGDFEGSKARFRQMVGHEAAGAEDVSLAFPLPYLESLHRAISCLSVKDLLQFHFHNPFVLTPAHKKMVGSGLAAAALLVLGYLVASSALLIRTEQKLEEKLAALQKANAGYSHMEEQIKAKGHVYTEVAQRIRTLPSISALLNALDEKLPEGTVVNSLAVTDNEGEIKGTAPTASDVLIALSATPVVEGAHFTASVQKARPVRAMRGKKGKEKEMDKGKDSEEQETFSIGFRIR